MTNSEVIDLSKFYIDPLCNGTITITANVEEATEEVNYPESNNTAVECSATYNAAVTIESGDTFEFDITSGSSSYGDNLGNLAKIPAFFSSGQIRINAIVSSTAHPDNAIDITFDALMYISDDNKPDWYPYSLDLISDPDDVELEMMSYPMCEMITSPGDNIQHSSIGDNTNLYHSFSVGAWQGMRPIVLAFASDGTKKGYLPPVMFKITCKNNLTYDVTFSSFTVNFTFYYASDGILMNLGSRATTDYCNLYADPKYLSEGEKDDPSVTGSPRYLWAIADGYEGGEILHVFGYYRQTQPDNSTKIKCAYLSKVAATEGPNHSAVVYKSDISLNPITFADNFRMSSRGFYSDEYAFVVTPKVICQTDKFKDVSVVCKKDVDGESIECSPSDVDAIFYIAVKLREDDIDEIASGTRLGVTNDDFNDAIKTVRFYDVDKDFVPYTEDGDGNTALQVDRSSINNIFYDTLVKCFEEDVILVSSKDDVIPFATLKINSYDAEIPLYNGKSITFHESLTRCNDGVRSRDLLFFSKKTSGISNSITLVDGDKRYNVTLQISYEKYKGMVVHKDRDISET